MASSRVGGEDTHLAPHYHPHLPTYSGGRLPHVVYTYVRDAHLPAPRGAVRRAWKWCAAGMWKALSPSPLHAPALPARRTAPPTSLPPPPASPPYMWATISWVSVVEGDDSATYTTSTHRPCAHALTLPTRCGALRRLTAPAQPLPPSGAPHACLLSRVGGVLRAPPT